MNSMNSFKKPTHQQIDKAVALMVTPQHCRMFFGKLENPHWVAPLRERGFFSSPPKPMQTQDGSYHPAWPASHYLARMAGLAPDEVFKTLALIETENARVISDIAEAALALPGPLAAKLSRKVLTAIVKDIWVSLYADKGADLIVRLAGNGEVKAAISLADSLFYLRSKESVGCNPVPRMDAYRYAQLLPRVVDAACLADPDRAMHWTCDLLKTAVSYHQAPERRDDPDDFSCIWRPAVEDHPQNRGHDVADCVVTAVRSLCERVVREDLWSLPKTVEFLRSFDKLIFDRVGLHLSRLFVEKDQELTRQQMLKKDLFDDSRFRHEYALLLRDCFPMLSIDDQSAILRWIEQGPDRDGTRQLLRANLGERSGEEMVDRYIRIWQRDRLSWFCASLPPQWKERYDQLVSEFGEPEHADFTYWMESRWGGGEPPKKAAELASMSTPDIVAFLTAWRPDPDKQSGPSINDLAEEFASAARDNLERFASEAPVFADVHPSYLSNLLMVFWTALQNQRKFALEPVVELCLTITGRPTELAPGHRIGGDPDESDQSWEYAKNEVTEVVRQICDHGDAPLGLRGKLWQCLARSEPLPDKSYVVGDPQEDARMADWTRFHACNNLRARLIHAVIRYAVWVKTQMTRERGGDAASVTFADIPEAKALLGKHLEPEGDDSPAVRSEYGRHFPALWWIDADWSQAHANDVFTLAGSKRVHGWAAWNAYIVANGFSERVFGVLRATYSEAIAQITPELADSASGYTPLSGLGEHMVILCGRGLLPVEDENGLLRAFFRNASPSVRGRAIEFVGRSLTEADPLPEKVVRNFMSLWNWYWSEFGRQRPAKSSEQFTGFGWWLTCGKFDTNWCLDRLAEVTEIAPLILPEKDVLDKLGELAQGHPTQVILVVDRMVRGDKEGWHVIGYDKELASILNAVLHYGDDAAKQQVQSIMNHLGRRGYIGFGKLVRRTEA